MPENPRWFPAKGRVDSIRTILVEYHELPLLENDDIKIALAIESRYAEVG